MSKIRLVSSPPIPFLTIIMDLTHGANILTRTPNQFDLQLSGPFPTFGPSQCDRQAKAYPSISGPPAHPVQILPIYLSSFAVQ